MITPDAFRILLLRCFRGKIPQKIMVALSGGVDSMCLTYLLHQYKIQFDPTVQIHAMTIDHSYRPESAQEAVEVGKILQKWGVSHSVTALQYSTDIHEISNFEEVARTMRYQAFQKKCKDLGIGSLLVAHNLNDQLETYLQRLQMNSTLYGLAGLKEKARLPVPEEGPEKQPIYVYRPLLLFDKDLLYSTCVKNDVSWFEDRTNADILLTKRNLLRHLINDCVPTRPELACLSKSALVETTSQIAEAVDFLQARVAGLEAYVKKYGSYSFDEKNASISFEIPQPMWAKLHVSTVSRWLFHTIYPISSAKHFHWSYAKIERQAVPRIFELVSGKLKMTYLNVAFNIQLHDGQVKFLLSRQPHIRSKVKEICQIIDTTSRLLPWKLYDGTWWVRVGSASVRQVLIQPFDARMGKEALKTFPDLPKITANVPVVLDSSHTVLAVPTHGFVHPSIELECRLKAGEASEKYGASHRPEAFTLDQTPNPRSFHSFAPNSTGYVHNFENSHSNELKILTRDSI